MSLVPDSPPRAPPVKYKTPLGTRWEKEKASAEKGAYEYPEDARFVGPWVIGECVGKGASGHVKIARHRRTGQLAAVKILPLQPFVNSRTSLENQAKTEKQRLGIDREITMMKLMNHPNIMRIYDVYEGDKELYLILEYVEGGELFDFLVNRGKLGPLEALGYFKQIVYGLNYAHTFSIIHRDLKPENILIHSLNPPLIKIADWGMAAFAPPSLQLETSCGSPHYASPEIVNGHKYTGTATDIWSCGVILYALLTGRLPFDDKNVRTLLQKVKMGKYDMPAFVDPLAKDLLSRMLVVDVHKRITMAEILAHPWLEGPTFGITYVPAPPVEELAKPLPSALHIDRDLFESLCVIWGRHANFDVIKADLLSPAGKGTLVKAFYFLLLKHRERTMEEHGILMDVNEVLNSPGKVVMKQYAAPRTRIKLLNRDTQSAPGSTRPQMTRELQLRASRAAPVPPPSRSPSPQMIPIRIPAPVPMERNPSRQSPIGPRPQKPRPASSPASQLTSFCVGSPPQHSGAQFEPARPRSVVRPRPNWHSTNNANAAAAITRALPPVMDHPTARSAAGIQVTRTPLSHGPPLAAAPTPHNSVIASDVIHAPIPVQATAATVLPMITAPQVENTELQRTFDRYANMVNAQVSSWNREQSQSSQQDRSVPQVHRPYEQEQKPLSDLDLIAELAEAVARGSDGNDRADDKENWDQDGAGKKQAQSNPADTTGGLGFGMSVPMGREMANRLFAQESPNKDQLRKEKKGRPTTMDIGSPPASHRRPNFTIGSPPLVSPTSTLIGSPVVGEFKDWFSNLFHWKAQSFILYSVDDMVSTRTETARLLEQFGVVVAVEENPFGSAALKCRIDDAYDGNTIVQKQMRFRVEFTSSSSSSSHHQPFSPNPMSPVTSSFATSTPGPMRNTARMSLDNKFGAGAVGGGYETMIAIVQEKGSASTFKAVCHRVRMEWRLDALQSPMRTVVAMGGGGHRDGASMMSIDQRFHLASSSCV